MKTTIIIDRILAYSAVAGMDTNQNYARIWLASPSGVGFAPISAATGIEDSRQAVSAIADDWEVNNDPELKKHFRQTYPTAHRKSQLWTIKPAPSLEDAVKRARDILRERGETEFSDMLDALVKQRGLLDECHTAIYG